jgi:uncharacterized protein (DUF983 family)
MTMGKQEFWVTLGLPACFHELGTCLIILKKHSNLPFSLSPTMWQWLVVLLPVPSIFGLISE